MIVDDYDYPTEKTDVVVVSPPGSEPESAITADDRTFLSCLARNRQSDLANKQIVIPRLDFNSFHTLYAGPLICTDIDSAMMAKLLPNTLDLEVEAESVSTWRLSDWRKMERKSHGPIFQCGGYPWLVYGISLPGLDLTSE